MIQASVKLNNDITVLRSSIKIIGAAVISSDGFIASNSNPITYSWTSNEDVKFLQSLITESGICVVGRKTHELYPSKSGKPRVIFTRGAPNHTDKDIVINPEIESIQNLLKALTPHNSSMPTLVLGGAEIYALFLKKDHLKYDEFYLTVEDTVQFGEGTGLFAGITAPRLDDIIQLLRSNQLVLNNESELGRARLLRFKRAL